MGSSRATRPKDKSRFSITIRYESKFDRAARKAAEYLSKMFPKVEPEIYAAEDGQKYSYIILKVVQ